MAVVQRSPSRERLHGTARAMLLYSAPAASPPRCSSRTADESGRVDPWNLARHNGKTISRARPRGRLGLDHGFCQVRRRCLLGGQ